MVFQRHKTYSTKSFLTVQQASLLEYAHQASIMGRTEKSQGLAPPAIRKDIRAKQARHIINKVVPSVIASNARARRGADNSELIVDPGPASSQDVKKIDEGGEDAAYVKRKGQGRRKAKGGPDTDGTEPAPSKPKSKKSGKRRNNPLDKDFSSLSLHVAATAPTSPPKPRTIKVITTDSLTAAQNLKSTLNPSKKSPNVCILNMASPLRPGGGVLAGATSQEEFLCARTTLLPSLKESFYRLPELGGVFTRDVLVFRTSGPLGESSGELGNAERFFVDVVSAGILRFPDLEGGEDEAYGVAVEDGPKGFDEDEEDDEEGEDKIAQELQAKITELESQISKVWNPDLKLRLGSVLEGLKEQLRERQGEDEDSEEVSVMISDDEEASEGLDELVEGVHEDSGVDADDLDSGVDDVNSGVAVKS
ncbi:hypothetical protein E8E11_011286 [Didymella keratinophila]|nr:hypothetical protein E8E11_011286 [Didymella keratinophila]